MFVGGPRNGYMIGPGRRTLHTIWREAHKCRRYFKSPFCGGKRERARRRGEIGQHAPTATLRAST